MNLEKCIKKVKSFKINSEDFHNCIMFMHFISDTINKDPEIIPVILYKTGEITNVQLEWGTKSRFIEIEFTNDVLHFFAGETNNQSSWTEWYGSLKWVLIPTNTAKTINWIRWVLE